MLIAQNSNKVTPIIICTVLFTLDTFGYIEWTTHIWPLIPLQRIVFCQFLWSKIVQPLCIFSYSFDVCFRMNFLISYLFLVNSLLHFLDAIPILLHVF